MARQNAAYPTQGCGPDYYWDGFPEPMQRASNKRAA